MLLGPLFGAELIRTSRRARPYLIRAICGGLLLGLFAFQYDRYANPPDGRAMTVGEVALFARATTNALLAIQWIVILELVPLLAAGRLPAEEQRRTLPMLLASRLSSAEVVLGIAGGQWLGVLSVLAVGLPVVVLMGLFGGVDAGMVAVLYAGTASTALLLVGLAMAASVHASDPRLAIVWTYLLVLVGLLVVPYLLSVLPMVWPGLGGITLINAWLLPASPIVLLAPGTRGLWGTPAFARVVWEMIGSQVVYAVGLLALAVVRLRPAYRARQDRAARRALRAGKARRRPGCGDAPMLWKETQGVGQRRVPIIAVLGGTFILGLLLFITSYDGLPIVYRRALGELERYGFDIGPQGEGGLARDFFNRRLQPIGAILGSVWVLLVAATAAAGISGERDRDTWTSLVATPLEGRAILGAKILGPLWRLRLLGLVVLVPWVVGLGIGAVHPLGLLAEAVGLAILGWLVSALGTIFSLLARSTQSALAWTVCLLLAVNLGPMLALFTTTDPILVGFLTGSAPVLLAVLPFSPLMFLRLTGPTGQGPYLAVIVTILVLVEGLVAYLLTRSALRLFDRAVGRPRITPLTHRDGRLAIRPTPAYPG